MGSAAHSITDPTFQPQTAAITTWMLWVCVGCGWCGNGGCGCFGLLQPLHAKRMARAALWRNLMAACGADDCAELPRGAAAAATCSLLVTSLSCTGVPGHVRGLSATLRKLEGSLLPLHQLRKLEGSPLATCSLHNTCVARSLDLSADRP